jgi:hypothetical protein
MQPRIYTYKITFEEVPYWYWGVHKEKKFGELYLGSPVTHKWVWGFYTPEIRILELFPFTETGWKQACEIENRLILPDLNNSLCLNERCGPKSSLLSCANGGRIGGKTQGRINVESGHMEWIQQFKDPEQIRELGRTQGLKNVLSGQLESLRTPEHQRLAGKAGGLAAVQSGQLASLRTPEHQREAGKKGGYSTIAQRWEDPLHPEVGQHPAFVLVRKQKALGYPHGKENRVRVE